MEIKTLKAFQTACNAAGWFALVDIQHHYRLWRKTGEEADTYIAKHLPAATDIPLLKFCADNNINTGKIVSLLTADGIAVSDTLLGLYISDADAAIMLELITAYKPLKKLFEEIRAVTPKADKDETYRRYCAQNAGNALFRTIRFRAQGGELFFLVTNQKKVEGSIRKYLKVRYAVPTKVAPKAVSKPEIKEEPACNNGFVSVGYIANELATETSSTFDYRRNSAACRCKDKLHRYIEDNDAWELDILSVDEKPELIGNPGELFVRDSDADEMRRHLRLWISGFGKTNNEKLMLLLQSDIAKQFPKTVKLLSMYYLDVNRKETAACAKSTVDFLFSIMPAELTDMTDDEIGATIIAPFFEETGLANQDCIVKFLYTQRIAKRNWHNDAYVKHSRDIAAYEMDDFAIMQTIAMSDEEIAKRELIRKAVENPRFAAAWLYVISHYFGAWRSTDIVRLPTPALPYSADETLARISDGRFTDGEAEAVANYELALITSREMKPHKTQRFTNVTPLILFVPQNLKRIFGLVLAIRTAHYQRDINESNLVKKVGDVYTLERFFGHDFVKACGGRNFATRKANKALMQGVANVTSGNESYFLPATMRNHKNAYGTLSPTTAIYLQDNSFAGVTPQFVIDQIGQRGFCGWLTQALLEQAYGSGFEQLPIKEQTALITNVGIGALEIDGLAYMMSRSELLATEAIRALLADAVDKKKTAEDILLRLITGGGVAKSGTCVLLAASKPCADVSRQNCLGCRFEVLERKIILKLKHELDRVTQTMETDKIKKNSVETKRLSYLLENVIIPQIVEICTTVRDVASREELQLLLNMAEKGLQSVAS